MRIIACIKAAPDDADIVVNADRTLDFSRAQPKVGGYDLNVIEAARQLADSSGGEVIGLTAGGDALANTKLRKDALSRGLDSLVIVPGSPDADSYQTASALASALGELGAYDLVVLGRGKLGPLRAAGRQPAGRPARAADPELRQQPHRPRRAAARRADPRGRRAAGRADPAGRRERHVGDQPAAHPRHEGHPRRRQEAGHRAVGDHAGRLHPSGVACWHPSRSIGGTWWSRATRQTWPPSWPPSSSPSEKEQSHVRRLDPRPRPGER